MNPANTRTIDEAYAAQPGHRFGQPTPAPFIAGWRASEARMQIHTEEAQRQAQPLHALLHIEAAYNAATGECIGLRIKSPVSSDGRVALACRDGLRVGRGFVPSIGEHIVYRAIALSATDTVTDEVHG